MTMYKAIVLAGLVLGLTTLSPISALANAGGTERTVNGTGSITISLDPRTGAFTGDATGISSHLGDLTVRVEGAGRVTPDGTFAGSGTVTITAANGDQLTGTFTLTTTDLFAGGGTTTVIVTITGGTGRFADATGTLTIVCRAGPPSHIGALLVIEGDCTMTGRISY
jgi:hypothetical protein